MMVTMRLDLPPPLDQIVRELRLAGYSADYSFTPAKPDKQFKRALESKAAHTVKLERAAHGMLMARTRQLAAREERLVSVSEVTTVLAPAAGEVK